MNALDEYSGSIKGHVIRFDPAAIPKPDTLHIRMTRGKSVRGAFQDAFGAFEKVVIDLDGDAHEYDADTFIGMIDDFRRRI